MFAFAVFWRRSLAHLRAFAVFWRRSSAHIRAFAVFGGAQRHTSAPLWFLQCSEELTWTLVFGNVGFFHVCLIFIEGAHL
jgi:hypothetical protein